MCGCVGTFEMQRPYQQSSLFLLGKLLSCWLSSILYPRISICVCAIPAGPTHYKCMSYPPLSCYNLFLQFSFCSTYSLQLLHVSSLTSSSPSPRLPEFSSYLYETENLTKMNSMSFAPHISMFPDGD